MGPSGFPNLGFFFSSFLSGLHPSLLYFTCLICKMGCKVYLESCNGKRLVRCLAPGKSWVSICYGLYCSIGKVTGVLQEDTSICHPPNPQALWCTRGADGPILRRRQRGGGWELQGRAFVGPRQPLRPGAHPPPGLSSLQSSGRRQWLRAPPGQRGPAGGAPLPGVLGGRYKGGRGRSARGQRQLGGPGRDEILGAEQRAPRPGEAPAP